MNYDDLERSNYDAQPLMLYEFRLGTARWLYCSTEYDVTVGDDTFSACPISDSGLVQSGDVQNDDFTVTMPAYLTFSDLFVATPPSDQIGLIVRRFNWTADEAPIVWIGTVKSTKRTSVTSIDIICKTTTASLNRNGLRLAWGKGCPHALYDLFCRAEPAAFATVVQIEGLNGANISSAGIATEPSGYFAGGYVMFELISGVIERRSIELHSGGTVLILGTTDGMTIGQFVTLYAGCDRTSGVCEAKFNNLSNYGGFPHLPDKSPFDGDPVF